MKINDILIQNYFSIIERGFITKETNHRDFILKLQEEVEELIESTNRDNFNEEIADVLLTVFNYGFHYNVDIEKELTNKIQKNFNR